MLVFRCECIIIERNSKMARKNSEQVSIAILKEMRRSNELKKLELAMVAMRMEDDGSADYESLQNIVYQLENI